METWIAQHFFNPTFVAGGAALVAAPILIHLINRLRYRRVRFAAMEFLLESDQRNQRRILFEQLLLLLLRILIVLAIVALVAGLILDPNQLSLFRGAQEHHLVLLDDSGSMRNHWGDTTAFDEALDTVRKLTAEGAARPGRQKFSLMRLSDVDNLVFSQRDVDDAFQSELETTFENLRCSYRMLDLVAGLEAAREMFADEKATIQYLHVVSDFRERDWLNQKALSSGISALDDAGVTVNLVKTVPQIHDNLSIVSLSGDIHVAATEIPVRLRVKVKNFGLEVAKDVRLAVAQDGQRLPLSLLFEEVEPGAEVEREFDVRFASPNKHSVRISVAEPDALSDDNSRYLALDVSQINKVLIVDGDPLSDEGLFLADALAPGPGTTGYEPEVESLEFLRRNSLEPYQSVFLLNIPELPADSLQALEQYVADGGGLAWFLGESAKSAFYNEKLYRESGGIFPVRLAAAPRDVSSSRDNLSGPKVKFLDHPIFQIFLGRDNLWVELLDVYRFFPVAGDWEWDDQKRKDAVKTIATLQDGQPLVLTHEFGSGQVVTCLTSCGPVWNNFARIPSFVVFQLELQKFIAHSKGIPAARIVGEPIQEQLDAARYSEIVEVTAPEQTGDRVVSLQASPLQQEQADANNASPEARQQRVFLSAEYADTDTPGVYRMRLHDHNQELEERWFAYNMPIEESELKLATTQQILRQVGEDTEIQIQEAGSFQWIAGRDARQDVRSWLLALLVVLLICEQLLAYKMSYHPEVVGAPS